MCMETRSRTVRPRWRYLLLRRFKIQRVESKRVDAFENMTRRRAKAICVWKQGVRRLEQQNLIPSVHS